MGLKKGYEAAPQDTSNSYKRGEIYYIDNGRQQVGSEQKKNRPAIIVSNDANNRNSSVLIVVFLTSKPKADLPTHVTIRATGRQSVALCEQPTPIAVERIEKFVAVASDQEMKSVDIALEIALGLNMTADQQKAIESILSGEKTAEIASGGVLNQKEEPKAMNEADQKELKMLRVSVDNLEEENTKITADLHRMEGERNTYKQLYEELLKKSMGGNGNE